MILLIGFLLLAVACLISIVFSRSATAARRHAAATATSELEKTGLVPQGDVFNTFTLRGLTHGIDIDLTNRASKLPPGNLEGHVPTCVVRVAAAIPDQIVFQSSEIDRVMGLLPTAARVRTGYAPFDDAYAVFVGSAADATGGSYRSTANASPVPWAQTSLLERLLELGLLWIRVQEGCAELVFRPLPLEEVGRAAALGAAVALTSHGKPPPALSIGAPAPWAAWPEARNVLYFLWGGGAILGLALGKFLSDDDLIHASELGWPLITMSSIVIVGFSLGALRRGRKSS